MRRSSIRFPEDLRERLQSAADDRQFSVNFMVVKAVEDFLERLIPADELKLTRIPRALTDPISDDEKEGN